MSNTIDVNQDKEQLLFKKERLKEREAQLRIKEKALKKKEEQLDQRLFIRFALTAGGIVSIVAFLLVTLGRLL